jgi:hypothetical protein
VEVQVSTQNGTGVTVKSTSTVTAASSSCAAGVVPFAPRVARTWHQERAEAR